MRGLDTGADDYVPKPFAIEELLACMRSLRRRAQTGEPEDVLHAKDLTLNVTAHQVNRAGIEIELSQREFELLRCLLANKNRLINRDALLNSRIGAMPTKAKRTWWMSISGTSA